MEVLKGKCIGRLGMCTTIFLGLDPWVPTSPEFTPRVNPHYQSLVSLHVSYWTIKNRHSWNKYKIGQILNALDAQSILSMPPITSNARDQLIWTCTPSGNFSVKSADWQISELHAPPYLSPWRRWWQLNLPPNYYSLDGELDTISSQPRKTYSIERFSLLQLALYVPIMKNLFPTCSRTALLLELFGSESWLPASFLSMEPGQDIIFFLLEQISKEDNLRFLDGCSWLKQFGNSATTVFQ